MRPTISTMLLLAVLLGMLGAWQHVEARRRNDLMVDSARIQRERIEAEIRLRSALSDAELSPEGWVIAVREDWFGDVPRNPLFADERRQWLEVDVDAGAGRTEPRSLWIDESSAEWWYNPANGSVCARIPARTNATLRRTLHDAINR